MILKYGNYTHADNEVQITIARNSVIEENGLRSGFVESWNIRGVIHAADQAALTTALNVLEAAYAVDGRDLTFYEDDGTTETAHKLSSAAAIGGVRVTRGVSYPDGSGAEYITFRRYEITVEAEYPLANVDDPISWTQTLSCGGGTPRYVLLQTLTGPPIRQQVAQQTPYWCTQSGSAHGLYGWPTPAAPLFPDDEHIDQRRVSQFTPEKIEGVVKNFRVDWFYRFESASALVGTPSF